jgi:hypothetical protein
MPKNTSVDQNILRLCQLDATQWREKHTQNKSLLISAHLNEYLQIEHDNPNLIWLYTLILQNEVALPEGEVIAAMKKKLMEEEVLSPLAWRYLANGSSDDFRIVLDSQDPGDTPKWQWKILIYWLQILSTLRLHSPPPEPIQYLFLNDSLIVRPEDELVDFHGAWLHFDTMRNVLEEAEKRLMAGTLDQFAETELFEVVAWLAYSKILLDNNQRKDGWKYLSKKAVEWKADTAMKESFQDLKWHSALPQIQINDWIIKPVIDAWSLQRLAFSERHCGHRFVDGCLEGKDRIFMICNSEEKTAATLRLTLDNENWVVGDIKGFANSEVPETISWVGEEIARRYGNRPRHISL